MIGTLAKAIILGKIALAINVILITWEMLYPTISKLIRPWSKAEIDIISVLNLIKMQMILTVTIILAEVWIDVM